MKNKTSDKEFENTLNYVENKPKKVLQKTVDPDATGVIDMAKEISKPVPKPVSVTMSGAEYAKMMEQLRILRGSINANKMMGEALPAYKKQIPAMLEKAKELIKNIKDSGVAKVVGKRGLKAIPVVGTALGIADAAKAASEGDYKKAGMEALSAIDPTPLTDIYMAGQEVVDAMEDQEEPPRPKNFKALQADPSLIKAGVMQEMPIKKNPQTTPLKKLVGEVESPDIEEMDNVLNYEQYLKKKKRQLGYE